MPPSGKVFLILQITPYTQHQQKSHKNSQRAALQREVLRAEYHIKCNVEHLFDTANTTHRCCLPSKHPTHMTEFSSAIRDEHLTNLTKR